MLLRWLEISRGTASFEQKAAGKDYSTAASPPDSYQVRDLHPWSSLLLRTQVERDLLLPALKSAKAWEKSAEYAKQMITRL